MTIKLPTYSDCVKEANEVEKLRAEGQEVELPYFQDFVLNFLHPADESRWGPALELLVTSLLFEGAKAAIQSSAPMLIQMQQDVQTLAERVSPKKPEGTVH